MRRWPRLLKQNPCLQLLLVQLGGVVLYPFMGDSGAGRAAYSMFGILVLALTVLALRATPALTWVAVLIGLPAAGLLVATVVAGTPGLFSWSSAFESALYFYAGTSMLAYMLSDDQVTTDELFAVPAVFTLFAWAFAYLFVVLQALDATSFGADGVHRSWMDLLFLSFTTLSSTGLSDITPYAPHARSVVMLEQLAGVFYIAMVVTRLVSLRAARREDRRQR